MNLQKHTRRDGWKPTVDNAKIDKVQMIEDLVSVEFTGVDAKGDPQRFRIQVSHVELGRIYRAANNG